MTTSSRLLCPHNCLLPPHMADAIKVRGTEEQKQMVLELEKESKSYRLSRQKKAPEQSFMGVSSISSNENPEPKREIYDGQQKADLPGELARKEGDDESGNEAVDAAYDGSGATYNLFRDIYQRDSLDGKGMKMISTVHHRVAYNNAFWDGEQMVYGDGDGQIFEFFSKDLSVVGHELSHGVVQFSGGLIYQDQSGALNESVADVFGALTVQYKLGQEARDATWLVGDEALAKDVKGDALRSMAAPGTAYNDELLGIDPQPYHMDHYVITASDNGGVHINSGIPNHAFYLLSMMLGGKAWEKAGHIWYDTLQAINNPQATFQDWADLTVEKARERFGYSSKEMTLTKRAWKLVGINI